MNDSCAVWIVGGVPVRVSRRVGIWRFMKLSNSGTVNAVSPWRWLQTMPLFTSCCRTVATEAAPTPRVAAICPVWCGPGSEFGHGAKVLLLEHGQAIEAHAEEGWRPGGWALLPRSSATFTRQATLPCGRTSAPSDGQPDSGEEVAVVAAAGLGLVVRRRCAGGGCRVGLLRTIALWFCYGCGWIHISSNRTGRRWDNLSGAAFIRLVAPSLYGCVVVTEGLVALSEVFRKRTRCVFRCHCSSSSSR